MNATELIKRFIDQVVVPTKRERYSSFVESANNRHKFLDVLDHKLESELDLSKAKKSLDEKAWNAGAVLFSSSGSFGAEYSSVKEAYEVAAPEGGWLILDRTGRFAVFRAEGRIDDEKYFEL